MITLEQARQTITTYFIAAWASHMPLFIEGQTQPDLSTQTAAFVQLEITFNKSEQIAMNGGSPPLRTYGTVVIDIFLPMTAGGSKRLAAQDKLISIFAAKVVSEVTFRDVTALSVSEGRGWKSQTVLANFFFEQTTGA